MRSVIEEIKEEFLRHQEALDDLFQGYIKENLTTPVGSKFLYGGELCTVVGAILHPPSNFDLLHELSADRDIRLLLDIPSGRIESEPDSRATCSMRKFNKALEDRKISLV